MKILLLGKDVQRVRSLPASSGPGRAKVVSIEDSQSDSRDMSFVTTMLDLAHTRPKMRAVDTALKAHRARCTRRWQGAGSVRA